jgi:hypothetical protein
LETPRATSAPRATGTPSPTVFVPAYDSSGTQNQYKYWLYPVNPEYTITGDDGCDGDVPPSTPAELTVTVSTLSNKMQYQSSAYTYLNPRVPNIVSVKTRYTSLHGGGHLVIVDWRTDYNAPKQQVRIMESGETTCLQTLTR